MHPVNYNLVLATAMLEEMEAYLVSSEIFWPLDRQSPAKMPPFPRLTLGGLWLTLNELTVQVAEMSSAQAASCQRIELQMEAIRRKWPVGLERKASQELRSRLNLWGAYLVDLQERTDTPDHYAGETRYRVMSQHLVELSAQQPEVQSLKAKMQELDSLLRSFFIPGAFVWDEKLKNIYPPQPYWYLYGLPRKF